MVTYHDGDLLNSGCDMICHQVNEYGYMGAGIAKQIRAKYPQCYYAYKEYCKKHDKPYGSVYFHKADDIIIANCFSQICGRTDIQSLRKVIANLSSFCEKEQIKTLGIPHKYGSGLAVGDWDEIHRWFKYYFEPLKVELQIWKYDPEKEGL